MNHLSRELTAREKQSVRRLVTSECVNYDRDYECLPLDGPCYMFTIGFVNSSLCKWFQNTVLPLDPALEALFERRPLKACGRCGMKFPVNGRQAYCDACAEPARKAAAAARVKKHRKRNSPIAAVPM